MLTEKWINYAIWFNDFIVYVGRVYGKGNLRWARLCLVHLDILEPLVAPQTAVASLIFSAFIQVYLEET